MDPKASIPDQIAELVTDAVAKSQQPSGMEIMDVVEALARFPGIRSRQRSTFYYDEYEIWAGPLRDIDDLEQCLAKVQPLALKVAPEWVKVIPAGAGHGVLLLRYSACAGEQLLPVDTLEVAFDVQAAQRFRHEMQTLADHGLVHAYTRGGAHWMVGSKTGTIVLNAWHALDTGTPRECAEMLRSIDHVLEWQRDLPQRRAAAASRVAVQRTSGTPIQAVFHRDRVLLPVVHPISEAAAMSSIDVAIRAGCPGVFLIDQGMSKAEVLRLVVEVRRRFPSLWVGVNLLGLAPADALVLALDACEGRIDGIWSDNAGIDEHAKSQPQAEAFVTTRRARGWNGLYFGGVAFKYQREVAPANLGDAARKAAPLMDVICTSGPGTGLHADLDKIRRLREAIGPCASLALASGVTGSNVVDYMPYVDAFLVGTGLEAAFGVFDPAKVKAVQALVSATPPTQGEASP